MSEDDLWEMDAEVAEWVMGWQRWTCAEHPEVAVLFRADTEPAPEWYPADEGLPLAGPGDIPCYSGDIAAAWSVVEKFAAASDAITISYYPELELWGVNLRVNGIPAASAEAGTAPLAICLAALQRPAATVDELVE